MLRRHYRGTTTAPVVVFLFCFVFSCTAPRYWWWCRWLCFIMALRWAASRLLSVVGVGVVLGVGMVLSVVLARCCLWLWWCWFGVVCGCVGGGGGVVCASDGVGLVLSWRCWPDVVVVAAVVVVVVVAVWWWW